MSTCFICLKTENNLTNVYVNNSDRASHILLKLKRFIPELVNKYIFLVKV